MYMCWNDVQWRGRQHPTWRHAAPLGRHGLPRRPQAEQEATTGALTTIARLTHGPAPRPLRPRARTRRRRRRPSAPTATPSLRPRPVALCARRSPSACGSARAARWPGPPAPRAPRPRPRRPPRRPARAARPRAAVGQSRDVGRGARAPWAAVERACSAAGARLGGGGGGSAAGGTCGATARSAGPAGESRRGYGMHRVDVTRHCAAGAGGSCGICLGPRVVPSRARTGRCCPVQTGGRTCWGGIAQLGPPPTTGRRRIPAQMSGSLHWQRRGPPARLARPRAEGPAACHAPAVACCGTATRLFRDEMSSQRCCRRRDDPQAAIRDRRTTGIPVGSPEWRRRTIVVRRRV